MRADECAVPMHATTGREGRGVHARLGLTLAFLLASFAGKGPIASASLTPEDDASLTACMETLSRGWVQSSVDQANEILTRPWYSAADWQAWFDTYFNATAHPYTDDLRDYLWYPVFGWFDDSTHLKLQTSLIDPMWKKATGIVAAHSDRLGHVLYDDLDVRQSLLNAHMFFVRLGNEGIVDAATRQKIYQNYKAHIGAWPQFFSDAATIDVVEQPLAAMLRVQVWVAYVDTLPLTEALKGEIAETIQLSGSQGNKRAFWDRHGVLLMDNNQLGDAQMGVLDTLLGSIPADLRNLQFITIRDFLTCSSHPLPILLKGQTGGAINYYFWLNDGSVLNSFDGAPGSWLGPASNQRVSWDTWNHIAATYDGATMRVYLNGVESNSMCAPGRPVARSSEPLRIGHMPDFNLWMRGTLDEVKVFNRTLSSDEIRRERQMQPISTTGLVCYWNMDEGEGTLIADSSGLGHHGFGSGAVAAPGRVNGGRFFDGRDDQVVVEDRADLRLNGSMTLEAWVYVANESPWTSSGTSEMVNTAGTKLGDENQFPDDIAPRLVDVFYAVAAHEFNHVVDAYTVWRNPTLMARETQLIAQAGTEPLQYLRSMFGGTIFRDGPQEFFASISNEYFTDSWHTLELALSRFQRGYREPINQFLFFGEVYSQGGPTTKVYTMDTAGRITVNDAPIGRDARGRITCITRGETIYNFTLDEKGNVIACPPY